MPARETVDEHRVIATGFMNALYRMLMARVIDPALFTFVVPPLGARLWLKHVAPLDRAIRQQVHGEPPDAVHPIEQFYEQYADGKLPAFLFEAAPVSPPQQETPQ